MLQYIHCIISHFGLVLLLGEITMCTHRSQGVNLY